MITNSVNCVGDEIENSRDCYLVCFCYKSENVNYSLGFEGYKDSYDVCGGFGGEKCYEPMSISTAHNYNLKCCSQMNDCRDCEYSDLCRNSNSLFGCIGLHNKSFCILNKQYTEKDYWPLVDKIKTAMLKEKVYGEFFGPDLSPVPYTISVAGTYPGLTDTTDAKKYGFDTREISSTEKSNLEEVISSEELPDNIKDVADDILKNTSTTKQTVGISASPATSSTSTTIKTFPCHAPIPWRVSQTLEKIMTSNSTSTPVPIQTATKNYKLRSQKNAPRTSTAIHVMKQPLSNLQQSQNNLYSKS